MYNFLIGWCLRKKQNYNLFHGKYFKRRMMIKTFRKRYKNRLPTLFQAISSLFRLPEIIVVRTFYFSGSHLSHSFFFYLLRISSPYNRLQINKYPADSQFFPISIFNFSRTDFAPNYSSPTCVVQIFSLRTRK